MVNNKPLLKLPAFILTYVMLATIFPFSAFSQTQPPSADSNVKRKARSAALGSTTISGHAFHDLSANGLRDSENEPGVAGVTVEAFDSAGAIAGSTVTNFDGSYSLSASGTGPYRIEFSNFPGDFMTGRHSTSSGRWALREGSTSGSSIQFVNAQSQGNVNLALYSPAVAATLNPVGADEVFQNGHALMPQVATSGNVTLKLVDITQLGTLWDDPANRTPNDMSPNAPIVRQWTQSDFNGSAIYSTSFDRLSGTIFAATSPYYGSNRLPQIFRIHAKTGAVSLLATLPFTSSNPNNSRGISSIEYDPVADRIVAASMEDGKIYIVDATTGQIIDNYDPRTPDASGADLPPVNELVMSVTVNQKNQKIYYAMWDNTAAVASTIYSIALDAAGSFRPSTNTMVTEVAPGPTPEFPEFAGLYTPVTDIEFNKDFTRVLVCENSLKYDPIEDPETILLYSAHNSRLLEYAVDGEVWTADPTIYNDGFGGHLKYEIGEIDYGNNARGGAAWGYKSIQNGNVVDDESFVVATGDTIVWDTTNDYYIYGITMMPSTGGSDRQLGNGPNSVSVDLDNGTTVPDKWVYGDVDIRKWNNPLIEVGNVVWADANENGVQDANETGIPGVTVNLYMPGIGRDGIAGTEDDSLPVDTTVTNVFGEYYFLMERTSATIEIRLDDPANFAPGGTLNGRTLVGANMGHDGIDSDGVLVMNPIGSPTGEFPVITATSPSDRGTGDHTYDFGFIGVPSSGYSLGNRVWYDTNDNGIHDPAEVGISNISVSLFADADANGVIDDLKSPLAAVTTDAQGYYLFGGLDEGHYIVRVDPSNFANGAKLDKYHVSAVTESDPNQDVDLNNNGIDNANPSVNGVQSGTVSLGPGFSEPVGEASPNQFGDGSISGVQSQDDLSNETVDFGFNTMSLSGHVFYDPFDTALLNEIRVPGITVQLHDAATDMLIATTVTGDNEVTDDTVYVFKGLRNGSYVVRVAPFQFGQQIGMVSSTGGITPEPVIDPNNNVPGDDNGVNGTGQYLGYLVSQPIQLDKGDEPEVNNSNGSTVNPTVDFGFIPGFSIGNRVWFDANNNGLMDGNENGIANVSVSLFHDADANGIPDDPTSPIDTLTTDAAGYYRFDQLYAGNYVVRINPSNFQAGQPLWFMSSSTGHVEGDSDIDLADHGIDSLNAATDGIFSGTVTLNFETSQGFPLPGEPTGEEQPVKYGAGSTNGIAGFDGAENLTIDFGFFLIPSSSGVSVSGTVKKPNGAPIGNLLMQLTESDGTVHSFRTSRTGAYRFDNIEAGQNVIVTVISPRIHFDPASKIVNLSDEVQGLDFTSVE